jgi:hypothetical protein
LSARTRTVRSRLVIISGGSANPMSQRV